MPAITDIGAYSALDTAFQPRILARNSAGDILLDGYLSVASMTNDAAGVFFIPFRPNQSPQTWMYVYGAGDARKLSVPDGATVTDYPVGVQEPAQPVEAAPKALGAFIIPVSGSTTWLPGGTAGAIGTDDTTIDTIGVIRVDPASVSGNRYSLQVSSDKIYQIGQTFYFNSGADDAVIQDVLPPINDAVPLLIDSVYYFSGSTGRCIIVPRQTAVGASLPSVVDGIPLSDSVYTSQSIASLRRGALVQLTHSATTEIVLILSVTRGPNGSIAFECVTSSTFAAADTITGIPAIVAEHANLGSSAGDQLRTTQLYFDLATGTGYIDQVLTANPFTTVFSQTASQVAQMDDYVSLIISISDLSKLVTGRIIFNVDPVSDYAKNVFYADFTASDILSNNPSLTISAKARATPSFEEFLATQSQETQALLNAQFTGVFGVFQKVPQEQLRQKLQDDYNRLYGNPASDTAISDTTLYPADMYALIQFPIRAFTRGGQNQNLTLANCNGVRISLTVTGDVTVRMEEIWVGGGGQPDVGRVGSPYFYCVRPRNTTTGATGNPSPPSRYGVNPRRQPVNVDITDYVGDDQHDVWDVFRQGGTVLDWRYVGTTPNLGTGQTSHFTDDKFDTTILTNPSLEFDNFQPWPSVDLPWTLVGTATINGTALTVAFTASSDVPANILNWLPGTILTVAGTAYTLWTRPTLVTGTTYLIRTYENMGSGSTTDVQSNEPFVANQHLPYVWGPDANGTVFGCGDPLRPGTLYYAKSNNPDSAPDTYNQEITTPSEPLLGGEVLNGLSYVSSSSRWFALYPDFGSTTQRYQVVERPIGRALAAPYGHCNDGRAIYFWATDGVWMHDGTKGQNLTDGPLQNLFPREGVSGNDVTYASHTIYAPDYRYASQFRIGYAKGYLYADYRDSSGTPRTLVLDLTRQPAAWVVDEYADPVTVHYFIKGPESNLIDTPPTAAYQRLVMGDANGSTWTQQDFVNDGGVAIPCAVSTFEFNGGDIRANQFWSDGFLDGIPASGITAQPVSDRALVGVQSTIPASTSRTRSVLKSSNIEAKSLGYLLEWDEDFDYLGGDAITQLFGWQPLYQAVPIAVYSWITQRTSFGLDGYSHIREILAAYRSTADVIITLTAYDGNSPAVITLPSTGGVEQKVIVPCSFNKALLWTIQVSSTEPWTPYFDAWEFHVGQWARTDAYRNVRDIEAPRGLGRSIES